MSVTLDDLQFSNVKEAISDLEAVEAILDSVKSTSKSIAIANEKVKKVKKILLPIGGGGNGPVRN